MTDIYLRPGKILGTFSRQHPDAWKQVDEFRAGRKELGNWPDWCFLPLAGIYAIVSKGKTLQSSNQAHHIGIVGALAAWRVTQGIYRFDPTTFDALWKTPVTGDIPTEVLFHLPEWCVYILTPDQTWQGATLNGFFGHLECDMNDRRTELRLVLDVAGPAGDELIVMPIHDREFRIFNRPRVKVHTAEILGVVGKLVRHTTATQGALALLTLAQRSAS